MNELFGVYFKGRLVAWFHCKLDAQKYVGKHQMSAYIGPIKAGDLEKELNESRGQRSSGDYQESDRT